MREINIIKIVCGIIIVISGTFIGLYYLKRHYNNILSKYGAIKICTYIVTTKVNKNLHLDLTESTYFEQNNNIIINLFFKNYNIDLKKFEVTVANCVFDKYITDSTKIKLKKFYYQDIFKNTYIYFNTLIKVINIKTCDLK